MRLFGRFELRALIGKTERSMLWRVFDPRVQQEQLLCLPRNKPASEAAYEQWRRSADNAARVQHPHLAHAVEVGRVDPWPYIAYDRALGETLEERLARTGPPTPADAAQWIAQALEGLAFAHEAGHVHRDIQPGHLLIDAANQVRLIGLEVAQDPGASEAEYGAQSRLAQREAAEEDVLCMGLVLHRLLSGRPVLDEADLQLVLQRMPPRGQELVRLGWETPHPIPDPLRAIVNRASDRQARQRYHLARSFLRALDGWLQASMHEEGGAIALLKDKLQRYGHLPTTSGRSLSVTLGGAMESQHASELAALALKDMGLSLELLRRVNLTLKQQGAASGSVLNMQRAIAMLGLNGLQQAARALKPWPGILNDTQAVFMHSQMRRVHRIGQVAQALRPAGYDAEVVYLIALLQNLGRLLVQYHFPDDAAQIRQLMQPPEPTPEQPNPRGMPELSAAYAVLGCDIESMGISVARYWGFDDEVLHMMRRQPPEMPVRGAHGDAELLRLTCSLAAELVEALTLTETKRQLALEMATRRYARSLGLGLREVMEAVYPPATLRSAAPAEDDTLSSLPAAEGERPRRSSLRDRGTPPAEGRLAETPPDTGTGRAPS